MKLKSKSKSVLAIIFVLFIAISGVLSVLSNPIKIFGGLARGYLNTSQESSFLEKVGNSFKVFDERINEYFILHDCFIHSYGGIQKLLGRTLINDADKNHETVKLNNGHLTFKENYNSDLTGLKDYLINLKSICDSYDSELLYINKISKNTTNTELLPDYYPHIYSSNFNEIKPILENNGILVLDLEEIITTQNIDKYSLFYKTDHHWTPQAGLWVCENICSAINNMYAWNMDVDIFSIENYQTKNYPKSFLGSQGKRVGSLYGEIDDFDVVYPSFQTNLTVNIKDINFNKTGNFYETMIHEKNNITPDKLLNQEGTAYAAYMQGNHSIVNIQNNNIFSGKTALIVMDSYGCVVAPYLALVFEKLDCIDIREYSDSLEDYIKSTSPDIVIYAITSHQ
ncbi:MAG: hypothetical protein IKJ41_10695 [Clostridia bacterium]|nr:hypothetical protein [Clostridia bacterium]